LRNRLLLSLPMLGLSLWMIQAVIDTVTLPRQTFLDWLILRVPTSELLFRLGTFMALTLAGIILYRSSLGREFEVAELRKEKVTYASQLDNLPVGLYRISPDGRILRSNRRFAEILGFEETSELSNVNMNDLYVNKAERQAHLGKLREAPAFAEFELRRRGDGTVWVRDYPRATLDETGAIAYIDGVCVESHGIDAIMRDITEHKKLEGMKDQFIVAVTHELRTPLVSIKGYVDLILAKESGLSDTLKTKIEVVRRNTDRLLELTNDLLSIEYMDSGKLECKLDKLNVQELLAQCVEEIQPLLTEKKQEIRLEVPEKPLIVRGDRLRLHEVLMNLLTNANKFTHDNGHITINAQENDGSVTITVTDDGIGIDRSDLEHVFEPFAVIQKPTYFKGSGLGLSLAKKLVEAQDGKIWAESLGKGQGATVAFRLPKAKEEWLKVHG
jgi:PAS domain S-box-containing protein